MKKPAILEIEVFRPGTFTPMNGSPMEFSAADLSASAEAYDAETAPAPAVVGHPSTDAPAYGWAQSFSYDGDSERMTARVGDLEPAFAEAVRARRYAKISMALFKPDAPANPKPGVYYPKHIGFLGGAAPAVSGLKPVHFAGSDDETVIIEFGDPGFRDTASLFRRTRDFFIEQFGLERADEILPSYQIDWLEERAGDPPNNFSAPKNEDIPPVTKPAQPNPDAAFAAREADIARREAEMADRERARLHGEHQAFADDLADKGRLLPAHVTAAVTLLDALSRTDELDFADDAGKTVKTAPADLLKTMLAEAPVAVDFSPAPAADTTIQPAHFAAPDGQAVDRDGLETHAKALEYQRAHPDVAFLDAVRAVS